MVKELGGIAVATGIVLIGSYLLQPEFTIAMGEFVQALLLQIFLLN